MAILMHARVFGCEDTVSILVFFCSESRDRCAGRWILGKLIMSHI